MNCLVQPGAKSLSIWEIKRLDKRCIKLVIYPLAINQTKAFLQIVVRRSETIAAYRFLSNDKVTPKINNGFRCHLSSVLKKRAKAEKVYSSYVEDRNFRTLITQAHSCYEKAQISLAAYP